MLVIHMSDRHILTEKYFCLYDCYHNITYKKRQLLAKTVQE